MYLNFNPLMTHILQYIFRNYQHTLSTSATEPPNTEIKNLNEPICFSQHLNFRRIFDIFQDSRAMECATVCVHAQQCRRIGPAFG